MPDSIDELLKRLGALNRVLVRANQRGAIERRVLNLDLKAECFVDQVPLMRELWNKFCSCVAEELKA